MWRQRTVDGPALLSDNHQPLDSTPVTTIIHSLERDCPGPPDPLNSRPISCDLMVWQVWAGKMSHEEFCGSLCCFDLSCSSPNPFVNLLINFPLAKQWWFSFVFIPFKVFALCVHASYKSHLKVKEDLSFNPLLKGLYYHLLTFTKHNVSQQRLRPAGNQWDHKGRRSHLNMINMLVTESYSVKSNS